MDKEKGIAKVKELILENNIHIHQIGFEWKYIKKTGQLFVRLIHTPSQTQISRSTKMNDVYLNYEKWM